jgi:hypothetical protein
MGRKVLAISEKAHNNYKVTTKNGLLGNKGNFIDFKYFVEITLKSILRL